MFRAEGLSSGCHWEFMFDVQLQIPMTVPEPLGFKLSPVHVHPHKHERLSSSNMQLTSDGPDHPRDCNSFEFEAGILGGPRKKGTKRKILVQHVARIFWFFSMHAKPNGCLGKTKKPHISNMSDRNDVKGRERGMEMKTNELK